MKVFRAISATTAADVVGRCRSFSFFLSFTLTLSLFLSRFPSPLFFSVSNIVYWNCLCIYRCILAFARSIFGGHDTPFVRSLFRLDFHTPKNSFSEKNALPQCYSMVNRSFSHNSSILNIRVFEMCQFIWGTSLFNLNPLLFSQLFKVRPVIRRCERSWRKGFSMSLKARQNDSSRTSDRINRFCFYPSRLSSHLLDAFLDFQVLKKILKHKNFFTARYTLIFSNLDSHIRLSSIS